MSGVEVYLAVWWSVVLLASGQQNIDCTKLTSCSCTVSGDGGTIDLSPLDSKDPNNPKFKDKPSSDGQPYQYSYNPCSDFSEGSGDCQNVATCQYDTSQPVYYQLGNQDSVDFVNDPSRGLELQTSGTSSDNGKRTARIQLICDEAESDGRFEVQMEDPNNQMDYLMSLTSKYCCPQSGPPPSTTKHPGPPGPTGKATVTVNISIGTILCIVFAVLIPLYLIGGILYNKFRKGASGMEMLPNRGFWTGLPGLIKEGFFFVVNGIRSRCSSYQST